MTDLERAKAIVDEFNSPPVGAYYTRDALVGMISRALKEVREETIAPKVAWKGKDFAEKTFPNIFDRLLYVSEARHLNFDEAAYEASEYLKELITQACKAGSAALLALKGGGE